MKKSITRKLQIYMYSFGLFMGIIFPFYASLFTSWESIWFKAGALAAGIMVGFFCYTMVRVILLKEIRKIDTFASSLKNNDLTASIAIDSSDAIGAIVTNLSQSTDSIRTLVSKIHGTSETILSSLHQLRGFSDSMNFSAQEISGRTSTMTTTSDMISHNSKDIAHAVNKTAKSVSTINTDLIELTGSVHLVHEKCREEVLVTGETNALITHTRDSIIELATRSSEIASIITVIEKIADRTNLLAINAHVEAANAGVHGKSFAVVAREVKMLADQSMKSASEIEKLIGLVTSEIDSSHKLIAESADKISYLTTLADEISIETTREVNLLQRIDDELEEADSSMQTISHRINQNSAGFAESTEKLKSVNESIAQISREIREGTESILRLEEESVNLESMVRRFRV